MNIKHAQGNAVSTFRNIYILVFLKEVLLPTVKVLLFIMKHHTEVRNVFKLWKTKQTNK